MPVSASVREVVSAVSDKLGSQDDLLLVHLSSAGGENIHILINLRTVYFFYCWLFEFNSPLVKKNVYLSLESASLHHFNFEAYWWMAMLMFSKCVTSGCLPHECFILSSASLWVHCIKFRQAFPLWPYTDHYNHNTQAHTQTNVYYSMIALVLLVSDADGEASVWRMCAVYTWLLHKCIKA